MSEEHEEDHIERDEEFENQGSEKQLENVIQVNGMYNEWFLDYASYVILERAVPHVHDGLKPVQRRILHSLKELDDGRFHKVANAIGNTMKYHPHGDASIGDAMVQVGQKELLLDMQGNWGNIYTGDRAAAPRYIEVRLSKFALAVAFNAKTTKWLSSYDGRNKEPETLPMKFPLLLAHGVEGIAVGLACKILPHNFIELIDACVDSLKGKKTKIVPDFPTAGMADFSNYNDGLRGGKVKVRARIRKEDAKTLIISEIPYGTTTTSLIESILKANDRGKIRIKKIDDNTAEFVEIMIHLPKAVSPDKTIDGLYAFTDCEMSISPNSCVIEDDQPKFMAITDQLQRAADRTKEMLRMELEIRKGELEETWHFASLEKIFIEKRIYRDIEECETWEAIIKTIHKGLKPHVGHLLRKVTDEDVARLTEIRIKRISKFDGFKADEKILALEGDIEEVKKNLSTLTEYAIAYFKDIKARFGKGKERKTEIKTFEKVDATKVAVVNAKLQANLEEGFVGIGMKRDEGEYVCDCSDIDDIIVFRSDGKMMVTRVSSKAFVGKGIIHVGVWKKGDSRTVYNLMYRDGKDGRSLMKRFSVTSITRDKEYDLTKGAADSKTLYFTANPNGEAEVVTVHLRHLQRLKKLKFDIDFSEQAIKGRGAGGNMVTKYPVKRIEFKEGGVSTLGARKIWWDPTVQRLNGDGRGNFLGDFQPDDKILVLLDTGEYKLSGFDLSTHFDDNMIHLEKWIAEKAVSCVYYDGDKETWFVKRFLIESSSKKVLFISEHESSRLGAVTTNMIPLMSVRYNKKFKHTRDKEDDVMNVADFIAVKGVKAIGNKLSTLPVTEVVVADPDPEKEQALLDELMARIQPAKAPEAEVSEEVPSKDLKEPKADDQPEAEASVKAPPPEIEPQKDDVSEPIELSVDPSSDDDEEEPQISLF